jgi:hypothetical protein
LCPSAMHECQGHYLHAHFVEIKFLLPFYKETKDCDIIMCLYVCTEIVCSSLISSTNGSLVLIGCQSQWPRGLRHELSSLAPMLRSWTRIPLKAWMSVCVYSVFVLFCV